MVTALPVGALVMGTAPPVRGGGYGYGAPGWGGGYGWSAGYGRGYSTGYGPAHAHWGRGVGVARASYGFGPGVRVTRVTRVGTGPRPGIVGLGSGAQPSWRRVISLRPPPTLSLPRDAFTSIIEMIRGEP